MCGVDVFVLIMGVEAGDFAGDNHSVHSQVTARGVVMLLWSCRRPCMWLLTTNLVPTVSLSSVFPRLYTSFRSHGR